MPQAVLQEQQLEKGGLPDVSSFKTTDYHPHLSLDYFAPPTITAGVGTYGALIGGGTALCTVAAPGGKAVFCTGAIQLPGGYVLVSNFSPEQRRVNTGAVVGGVGAYSKARGTATWSVLARSPDGVEKTALVLRLTP